MQIEKIDDYDIKIYNDSFKITKDAILLSDYVINDNIKGGKLLEIGAGSGYISIKLCKYVVKVVALEIQKIVSERLKDNVVNNKLNIDVINQDVNDYSGKFDYIVSNPPYYKLNSGKYPENEIKKLSKFEFLLNLDSLVINTKRLLKENGFFYFIYPLSRKNELENKIEENGLKLIDTKEIDSFILVKGTLK